MLRSRGSNQLILLVHHADSTNMGTGIMGWADDFKRERVTGIGRLQVTAAARHILQQCTGYSELSTTGSFNIISSKRPNCRRTGELLLREMQALSKQAVSGVVINPKCDGVYLGLAAGRTLPQLKQDKDKRFQDYGLGMEHWYRGAADKPPQAPGGESIGEFDARMLDVARSIVHDGAPTIAVLQQSAYVAMGNVFRYDRGGYDGRTPEGQYRVREVASCAVNSFYVRQHGPPVHLGEYVPEMNERGAVAYRQVGNLMLSRFYLH